MSRRPYARPSVKGAARPVHARRELAPPEARADYWAHEAANRQAALCGELNTDQTGDVDAVTCVACLENLASGTPGPGPDLEAMARERVRAGLDPSLKEARRRVATFAAPRPPAIDPHLAAPPGELSPLGDELTRARARRNVRSAFASLDNDARIIFSSTARAGDAIVPALTRLLGSRLAPDELEELERFKALAIRIFSRLTPEELAELVALMGGKGGA